LGAQILREMLCVETRWLQAFID